MNPKLRRVASAVALSALVALLGGCASTQSSNPPPPPRAPELPPIKAPEVSPKDRAALHADLGAGYYERGRMDVAIEELTEAATLDPTNPRIYNYFGLVYAMLGENAKAEQNFQRALSLAPDDSDLRHDWGWYPAATSGHASRSRNSRSHSGTRSTRRRKWRSPMPDAAARRSATLSAPRRSIGGLWRARPPTRPRCTGSRCSLSRAAASTRHAVTRDGWRSPRARARSALSRHVRRAQGGRPGCRDPLRCPVAQPLPGLGRGQSCHHGAVRVTPPQLNAVAGGALPAGATAGALLVAAREASGSSIDAVAQ